MTALLRPPVTPSMTVAMAPNPACTFTSARVARLEDDGQIVVLHDGSEFHAALASHIPGLVEGQTVLLAVVVAEDRAPEAAVKPDPAGTESLPLVIAAWPAPGAPITPPWHFDRSTGTLSLAANNLELGAVNSVLLNCGEARMQFTRDGVMELRGQSITSAAIETHRIEGGSIELN